MGFFGNDPGPAFDEAGQTYKDYINQAINRIRGGYAEGRGDITGYYKEAQGFGAPYRAAGEEALGAYQASLGLGPKGGAGQQGMYDRFSQTPGYQFALNTAQQANQRRMAAGGLGGSGAEASALSQQAQDMANQEYGGYQNRLGALAGMGEQASEAAAGRAMTTGAGLGQLGYGYAGMEAGAYGALGKGLSEEMMAKEEARQKRQSSMWGAAGNVAGGGLGMFFGGPVGGALGEGIASKIKKWF